MTIERADVEALLATVEQVHKPNRGVIAELCRTWLAVDAAPAGEAVSSTEGYPAALNGYTHDDDLAINALIGKRVRLLALDSGGAAEVGARA